MNNGYWLRSVSYTHLDVYKRQGVDPDPAMVAQTRAAPLKATGGRMRLIKRVPAGLRGGLRHLQGGHAMAASAPPAVRVQRIGYRPRQQFCLLYTSRCV